MQKVMLTAVGPVTTTNDGHLRLIDLPVCHGYANCCVCPECSARAELAKKPAASAARQPWEPKAA